MSDACSAKLARFGHHPDPSTDFCCEIEMLEGWSANINAGLQSQWPFWGRLSRALRFARTMDGMDECAVRGVPLLRSLEARTKPPTPGTLHLLPHPYEPRP